MTCRTVAVMSASAWAVAAVCSALQELATAESASAEPPCGQRGVGTRDVERKVAVQPAIEDVLAQDKVLRVLTTTLQDTEDPDRAIKGLNADAVGEGSLSDVLQRLVVQRQRCQLERIRPVLRHRTHSILPGQSREYSVSARPAR
jgi:hypothetical protein